MQEMPTLIEHEHAGVKTEAEARSSFEASARLNPRFSPARAEWGKLLLRAGDVGGAIEQLETAVKLDPDNATAAYQLGQAYRRTGDTARAQEITVAFAITRDSAVTTTGDLNRVTGTPEPASMMLIGIGLIGLDCVRRRAAKWLPKLADNSDADIV